MTSSPQAQWITDAIQGDTEAFGRLIRAHSPAVCAITLAITRDPHSSEDVAQDVFLLAWTRLPHLKSPDSFGPWLRQISRNRSREYLRASRRRGLRTTLNNHAVDRALSPDHPERSVLDAEQQQVLSDALEALPDETREVLILYYREGRSVRQVATLLELSEPAVRKRLSRARERLRDDVEDRFEAVLLRTLPGVGLTLGVLTKLEPRTGGGVSLPASSVVATTGLATVGLLLLLGLALFLRTSGPGQPPEPVRPNAAASIVPTAPRPPDADADADAVPTRAPEPSGAPIPLRSSAHSTPGDLEGHAQSPVFGPDGRHLAYELLLRTGEVAVVVLAVGDSPPKPQVLRLPGSPNPMGSRPITGRPAWHPQQIVLFEGSFQGVATRLYYQLPGSERAAEMIAPSELTGSLSAPTLSADGDTLAFIHAPSGAGDLVVRATSTGALSQLTHTPQTESFPVFSSPTELLFTRTVDGSDDLYAVDLESGEERRVAGGPGDQTRPSPTADGERVVFFERKSESGPWALVRVDRHGNDPRQLATGVRLPAHARPALSPDGDWVAFAWEDVDRAHTVELARVDGTQTRSVATGMNAVGEPALGMVGSRVVLAFTALDEDGDWRTLHLQDVTDTIR